MRAWLFTLMFCLVLTACSKPSLPDRATPEAVPTGNEPIDIRIGYDAGDSYRATRLDVLISAFQGLRPEYRVTKVAYPGRFMEEATQQLVKQGQLDLISPFGAIGMQIRGNLVADLSPYIQKSRLDLAPFEAFLPELRREGKIFELPFAVSPYAVMYNKELVSAAGVTIPRDGWTWDQFRDIAAALTHGTGDDRVWGLAEDFFPSLPYPCVRQATRYANKTEEQAVQECFRLLHQLIFLDQSMPKTAEIPPNSTNFRQTNYFHEGKAAMLFRVLPMTGKDAFPFEWGFAPVPSVAGATRPVTLVGLESYALVSASPHPDAAWAFLEFMVGPEGALALAKSGFIPYYQSTEIKEALQKSPSLAAPGVEAMLDTAWVGFPWLMEPNHLPAVLYYNAKDFMTGKYDWEAAARSYLSQVESIRAGGRPQNR